MQIFLGQNLPLCDPLDQVTYVLCYQSTKLVKHSCGVLYFLIYAS